MKNLKKINDKFVEFLKTETNPNWVSIYLKKSCTGAYRSFVTNKPYSLGNSFMLAMNGERPGWFATFNQIKSLGGNVKKGAHGKVIFFWSSGTKETENEDGEKEKHRFMVLKTYNVFNVETDAEGIVNKWNKHPNAVEVHNDEIPDAEVPYREYCKRENIEIVSGDQTVAYYSPSKDIINIPNINNIVSSLEYYSAIYHECGHSTGAKNRLNRKENSKISSRAYAREELVAEFCAILSMNALNLTTDATENNSFAYLASFAKRAFGCATIEAWQTALDEDPYLIYGSIEKADKAYKMIFNIADKE